jgi:Gas vesicle synthesis protein GvpL/GvpF
MTRPGTSPPAPARDDGAARVYVYGIVRRAPRTAVEATGVASSSAIRVVGDGFAAVVSDVPAGWRAAGRADLQAHDQVLNDLMAQDSVIPMRFGMLMASDEEVRERLLERHADEFASLFELVQDRMQVSVKAYYVEDGLLREVLRRHPELKRRSEAIERLPVARSQPERIALGQSVAAAVEEQRALDRRALSAPLADLAEDVRVEEPASERQALNLQLLVDRARRPQLDATVQRLSEAHGDRFAFRYVGPLPPYSFTDVALEEA